MATEIKKTQSPEPFCCRSERHIDVVCRTHIHPEAEIVLVTEGVLQMTIGETVYQIPKYSGVFIPPFISHDFASPKPNRCHVLIFSRDFVPFFFDAVSTQNPVCHIFAPEEAVWQLADTLLPNEQGEADPLRMQAVLAPLCQNIYEKCTFAARRQPPDDSATLLLKYMAGHYTEDLSLETVGRAVGIHPVTVSKIFSKRMGISFHFHLHYLRCSYAARLLQAQNMTISEIAYEAGFGSTRSFNRAFQSIYGKTPSQYRRHSAEW